MEQTLQRRDDRDLDLVIRAMRTTSVPSYAAISARFGLSSFSANSARVPSQRSVLAPSHRSHDNDEAGPPLACNARPSGVPNLRRRRDVVEVVTHQVAWGLLLTVSMANALCKKYMQ